MNSFRSLQTRHEDLIKRSQAGEDVVEDVRKLIEDIKAGSSQISASNERDQLRSNLRYWASYLYEKTQSYPSVDLAPSTMTPRRSWLLPAIVVLVLVGIGLPALMFRPLRGSVQPTMDVSMPSIQATGTALAYISDPLTSTAPPTDTPVWELLTPTLSSSQSSNTLSIRLTSLKNGEQVLPRMDLGGTYTTLSPGYSIHVIIQPTSKGELKYPMPSFASLGSNLSGDWLVETRFGQGQDLKEKEQYLVWVVFAIDENARQALSDAVDTGTNDFPSGVVPYVGPIVVSRPEYSNAIAGPRLIYSTFIENEGNSEVFTTDLDGKDVRRLTNTSASSELFPSLSPQGDRIVYVARRRGEGNESPYTIQVMNGDGTSPETIVTPQTDTTYERPIWSGDGRYIAYVFGVRNPNGNNSLWNLAVYDTETKTSTTLLPGNVRGPRYISWVPNSTRVVFNSRIDGTGGFKSIDVLTMKEETFFSGKGDETVPVVSPNGSLLAYTDTTDGHIYVADLTTESFEAVTIVAPGTSQLCWGPDGKTIFYSTKGADDDVPTIWRITLEDRNIEYIGVGLSPWAGEMNTFP